MAAVPDGIGELAFEFQSAGFGATVTDNALLLPVDEWPAGYGTIKWNGGEAPLKSPLTDLALPV